MFNLNDEVQLWLGDIQQKGNFTSEDIAEMESHLLDQIDDLKQTGLNEEEAFLIAVKRLGQMHSLVHEYSRNRIEKLWKQLNDEGESPEEKQIRLRDLKYFLAALFLGIFSSYIPNMLGYSLNGQEEVYMLNLSFFFILPIGLWYFLKNGVTSKLLLFILPVLLVGFILNFYPFGESEYRTSHTLILSIIHLPLSLWLAMGVIYTKAKWNDPLNQMNFLRFTGESFIYSALIGLGALTTLLLTFGLFSVINIDIEPFAEKWIMPLIVPTVIIIAAFTVEKKKNIVENFAPVLARLFSPLFFITLFIFFIFSLGNLQLLSKNRDMLILFDLILVMVLALVIYTISARKERDNFGFYDIMNFALILIALIVNTMALSGILTRFFVFGLSPNRLAALGENLLLLFNLGAVGVAYFLFFLRKINFSKIMWMQSIFLPLYFAWTFLVAIGFPVFFKFV